MLRKKATIISEPDCSDALTLEMHVQMEIDILSLFYVDELLL